MQTFASLQRQNSTPFLPAGSQVRPLSSLDDASSRQAPPAQIRGIISDRIRALPSQSIANTATAQQVAPPNPARLAIILRNVSPNGYFTIGGSPQDGAPKSTTETGSLAFGLALLPYETLTLETTGEVWAIADGSLAPSGSGLSGSGILRVFEVLAPAASV